MLIKTHEEKSSEQLRPQPELRPQGDGAELSGSLVSRHDWCGGCTEVTCRLCVGVMCRSCEWMINAKITI